MNLDLRETLEGIIFFGAPIAALWWLFYRMSIVPVNELVDDEELERRINSKLKFF